MSTTETEKFEPVCEMCGEPASFVVEVDACCGDTYDACAACAPKPSAHLAVRPLDDGRRRR